MKLIFIAGIFCLSICLSSTRQSPVTKIASKSSCNSLLTGPVIHLWYGEEQRFGHLGTPQPLINILGNVSGKGVTNLEYAVNRNPTRSTPLGGDLHRLARTGDFNIEIPVSELKNGLNHVYLSARDSLGMQTTRTVQIHYVRGITWKLPYTVNWDTVTNIQNVVQVVDGRWKLEDGGIRVADDYYDRVIAIGDTTWRDFELMTWVQWNKLPVLVDKEGPPYFRSSHASVVLRWRGHPDDGKKPREQWWPLGCIAMYSKSTDWEHWKWNLWFTGKGKIEDRILYQDVAPVQMKMHRKYYYRMRAESLSDAATIYSVKVWESGQAEPKDWDAVARKNVEDTPTGSILLVAHNADVTFGPVTITPLN